jgi:hypothetical protein
LNFSAAWRRLIQSQNTARTLTSAPEPSLQEIPIQPKRFVPIATLAIASIFLTVSFPTRASAQTAQTVPPPVEQALLAEPAVPYSTSAAEAGAEPLPAAPAMAAGGMSNGGASNGVMSNGVMSNDKDGAMAGQSVRPFSRLGIAVTGGSGGIGLELATPLSDHFNLRASGSYFSYYLNLTTDGYQVNGRILTRNANLSVDYFPFHNGFRISPGVTLDNGNAVHGTVLVAGGQSFDLGDGTYTSDPNRPVTGVVALSFGNKVAPSFTVGWGNLVPHHGHLSVPFEIGFEYIGTPLVNFNLSGNVCDSMGDPCSPIDNDPTALADEQQQRNKINNDISPLRFFPILSLGIGWSF